MHVLLTNDDGIDAPGIACLEMAVSEFAEVTVIAPDRGYSGCGHQVTSFHEIRVEQIAPQHFKVAGTPADCVRLGLTEIAPDVDWVLSGVNDGGNLGVDLWMSGTAAAAREATWLGKRAIAFSQYSRPPRPRDWSKSQALVQRTVAQLFVRELGSHQFWNVNFPDVNASADALELVDAPPETQHMLVQFKSEIDGEGKRYRCTGDYGNRPRIAGSDVDVCFGGQVAVSQVNATRE